MITCELNQEIFLREIPFVAFDFETTGLDPRRNKVIEIGMVLFQGGDIKKTFHRLIDPKTLIPQEAFAIHGISNELLEGNPEFHEILDEVILFFSQGIPLAHNAPFDLAFLIEEARERNVLVPRGPVVDSCELSKSIFPHFTSHRLEFLVQQLGCSIEKAHRALSDAQGCALLFQRVVEQLPLKWETSWQDFCSKAPGILSLDGGRFELPPELSPLQRGVMDNQSIFVSYRDGKGKITEREITPMGFSLYGAQPILVAYCHLRQSTRNFRLDRILKIIPKKPPRDFSHPCVNSRKNSLRDHKDVSNRGVRGVNSSLNSRRFVILDRDGTINVDVGYLSNPKQIEFLPHAIEGLRLLKQLGLGLIVITNQSGVGRGYFDQPTLDDINEKLTKLLEQNGIIIERIYSCPHLPEDKCVCRKPKTALLLQAARDFNFDPQKCFVIGDKASDMALGKNVGAFTILVRTGYGKATEAMLTEAPSCIVDNLAEAALQIDTLLNL